MGRARTAGRDPKALVPDFHLWTSVAETVDPLARPRRARPGAGPLPLPPAEPPAAASPRPRARPVPVIPMPAYQSGPASGGAPSGPPGIEPRLRRRLGRGHVEIDARIDLHGMRQDEARSALARFIPARAARGDRTVLVITGKGLKKADQFATVIFERGVLRAMLPVWLSEPGLAPFVSGWHAAAQAHGGDGAFYVRLRSHP